jgi:hypothetical protein
LPSKVPIDAVQAGLEVVGAELRHQETAGVVDLDDDGILGRKVEDVIEGSAGVLQLAERDARR